MAEMNETEADIIADMRSGAKIKGCWKSCDLNEILAYHADRLEAAVKRERGNAAAMREALVKVRRELDTYCNGCTLRDRMTEDPPDYTCLRDSLLEIGRIVDAAIAKPPRNCDVGTVEEQSQRWQAFCDRYGDGCTGCPCNGYGHSLADCFAKWGQLPCETEGKA